MNKEGPKISEAEWQVMKVLWDKAPLTSSQIVEILKPHTKWSATTIYTLISRLVNKKAVRIEEGSTPNLCYPIISKEECSQKEYKTFLKKVYNGSLNLMLLNIIEDHALSNEEIDELKHILDKNKDRR
ncbi:MAG: BlaI/MecI/CopY family transcriptional regulator [Clostridiaceae bacterium]|nr:BlaI/MecI/CopY family transcriptional regulator [Clostridiaceae bacterium]